MKDHDVDLRLYHRAGSFEIDVLVHGRVVDRSTYATLENARGMMIEIARHLETRGHRLVARVNCVESN